MVSAFTDIKKNTDDLWFPLSSAELDNSVLTISTKVKRDDQCEIQQVALSKVSVLIRAMQYS